MKYLISIAAAAICCFGNVFSFKLFVKKEKELDKKHKILLAVISSVFAFLVAVLFPVFIPEADMSIYCLFRVISLLCFLIFTAYIDFKLLIIPNKMLLVMLIYAALTYGIEALLDRELFTFDLIEALIGCSVCFIIFLLCRLLSRNGMGMGDIKLAAVMGLFLGIDSVLGVMLWSVLGGAVTGGILMAAKKVKSKSKIAMAPFFFFGTLVSYIIFIISGGSGV